MKSSIGLAKVKYSSSVGHIPEDWDGSSQSLTLVLTERLNRKKASGAWPSQATQSVLEQFKLRADECDIAENRDVQHPSEYESALNVHMPFDEYLSQNGLKNFSSRFNNKLQYFPHHYAHALVAELMSPFRKALVIVIDGAGSRYRDIPKEHLIGTLQEPDHLEECSFYLLDKDQTSTLTLVQKDWQRFLKISPSSFHEWSQGVGMFYERIAEYIFNSNQAAGKVMGLASFGQSLPVDCREKYLDQLDWMKQYSGSSNSDWEKWSQQIGASSIAATVQADFESNILKRIELMRERFPDYHDLVFVGGCALNCTLNWKILTTGLASRIYIPPFPGDAGLGLGLAFGLQKETNPKIQVHLDYEQQITAYGLPRSKPELRTLGQLFNEYSIQDCRSDMSIPLEKLQAGQVIAWFSGRSESGPRALGHRSLLALPNKKGLKDYLNRYVKFREDFRPYGCSVLHSCAHHYFKVHQGFHNPFMSFAIPVNVEWKEYLNEVTHIDGTSRMQTVHERQNPIFHQLLFEMQKKEIPPVVLNTSLNIMGEPIVETLIDLKRFMDQSVITAAYVDGYLIEKKQ